VQETASRLPLPWQQLLILLVGRLALNTAYRIIYPLLALLADGLRVDRSTASLLVTAQVAATLVSPLGGRLSDRYGERTTMLGGLLLFCVGASACALAGSFAAFMIGYGLLGFGTALYHPSSQAYASARTHYSRRGQVLGILELSWALAALIGVTALSRLIEASGSWAPAFWTLLGAGVLVLLATLFGLPSLPHTHTHSDTSHSGRPAAGLAQLAQPSVFGALLLMFCTLMAAELIFVVYSFWLEADFGATTEQLGLLFGLLGFVELVGSAGSALLVDRIGKRRTVLVAFSVVAVLQALLPISKGSWLLVLPLFLLLDLWFEFAIVSAFPLISGLVPTARGTVLALGVAAGGLGRVVGSQIGPLLWERFGFVANGLLAGGMTLLGVIACLLFVREGEIGYMAADEELSLEVAIDERY
jgi:predicted MFS family arabinose efflux permease